MPKLRKIQKDPEQTGQYFRRRMANKDARKLNGYGQLPVKLTKADRAAQRRSRRAGDPPSTFSCPA